MTDMQKITEDEKKVAQAYIWWPVYLVRERRRLAGILAAVEAGQTKTPGLVPSDGQKIPHPEPAVKELDEEVLDGRLSLGGQEGY